MKTMVLSMEQARVQAWEMMLTIARAAQDADPEAAAAAKTLLGDVGWKEIIEAGVTVSPVSEAAGKVSEPAIPDVSMPDLSAEPEPLRGFLEKFYQADPSYRNIDIDTVKEYLLTLS